ncbi:hypothetical protein BH23CHL2_BH23CHL2_18750 [soil metagenome]
MNRTVVASEILSRSWSETGRAGTISVANDEYDKHSEKEHVLFLSLVELRNTPRPERHNATPPPTFRHSPKPDNG